MAVSSRPMLSTCLACKHSPSPLPRLGEVAAQRRVRVDRRVSRLAGPMLTTLSRQRERGQESAGTLNRYLGCMSQAGRLHHKKPN